MSEPSTKPNRVPLIVPAWAWIVLPVGARYGGTGRHQGQASMIADSKNQYCSSPPLSNHWITFVPSS